MTLRLDADAAEIAAPQANPPVEESGTARREAFHKAHLSGFERAARDHLLHPPATFRVEKSGDRHWIVVDADGTNRSRWGQYDTRRAAQADLDNGVYARLWQEHTDWLTRQTRDARLRPLTEQEAAIVDRLLTDPPLGTSADNDPGPHAAGTSTDTSVTAGDDTVVDPALPQTPSDEAVVDVTSEPGDDTVGEAEGVSTAALTTGPDASAQPVAAAGVVGPSGTPTRFAPSEPVLPPSGAKSRARANMAAIKVITELREQDRYATPDEQQVLARWSGWGAVPDIFDTRKPEWSTERTQLREMLSTQAWGQARRNTLNAHYTDPQIARAMWDALRDSGFRSGRVLEPGCGSGTFLAYAPEGAQMVGVELDSTTAEVAAALHPYAQIRNEGFEDTRVPADSFAATIGNVPFGTHRPYDPVHNQSRHTIHNYFILKSLSLTAPGGYVAVVTSRWTMDATDNRARKEMAALGDLVGAVRLPSKAFSRVAGTDVVTDIVVLRRREAGRAMSEDTRLFLQTAPVAVYGPNDVAESEHINQYFATYDSRILGTLRHGQGVHGSPQVHVDGPSEAAEIADAVRGQLADCIARARRGDLMLDADWDSLRGVVATDLRRGLVREEPGVVSDFAVGQLRYDASAEQIVSWSGTDWEQVPKLRQSKIREWAALLELRDLTAQVIESQREQLPVADREAARSALTLAYDDYVSTYGLINRYKWNEPRATTQRQHDKRLTKLVAEYRRAEHLSAEDPIPADVAYEFDTQAWDTTNSGYKTWPHLGKALRQDPTFATVLALEEFDDETQTARKAAIFHGDVLVDRRLSHQIEGIEDAVAATLDEGAVLDLDRVATLLDTTREEVETQLSAKGLAFRTLDDPDVWVPATRYLSGNVRRKLAEATEMAAVDPRYRVNVEHLTAVMPAPVPAASISVQPGVTWIERDDYRRFLRETFNIPPDTAVRIDYANGTWSIDIDPYAGLQAEELKWGVVPKAHTTSREGFNFEDPEAERRGIAYAGMRKNVDGTGGNHYSYAQMFTDLLNGRPPEINKSKEYRERTGGDAMHDAASRAAGAKMRRMAQEFEQWALFADPDRSDRLTARYNELFNSTVAPTYDGSAKQFPGLGPDFKPYPYQRNAVARICAEPTTLLDHVVGAGKTGTMIMAAMELRRLGLVSKPWIVVPNHIIEQFTREAGQWYPGAKILSGGSATDADGRRLLIAQSAAQDWDLVIVPLSAFKRVGVDPATRAQHITTKLSDLEDQLNGDLETDDSIKRLEAAKAKLEEKLEEAMDEAANKADLGLTFEASGCDYLFIDEAHNFKNLARECGIEELALSGSDQATDLSMKLAYLREMRRSEAAKRGVGEGAYVERVATFATGTPVSNSMAEEWVWQTYLRPDLLADAGVERLEAWGQNFTTTVTRVELNSSGTRLYARTRVADYMNAGDMIAISVMFTDVVTREEVPATLPEKDSRVISYTPAEEVMDFIHDLGERSDRMRSMNPKIDNSLKVANDGRNVSLSAQIAGLDREPHPDQRRPWVVAQEMLKIHNQTKSTVYLDKFGNQSPVTGGVQIAFCDRSTPKPDGSFSLYDEIRDELIAGGMDPDAIRYIHHYPKAADKAALFEACRNGKVSVLLGSTPKMGTGTNIQARATATHHIDAPWKPDDIEQRIGRAERQGNQNAVFFNREYVAERTYDTVMWQTIHRKAAFLESRRTADRSLRRMPNIFADDMAESAATTKAIATGDPRYLRQVELDAAVGELQAEADSHFSEQRSMERDLKRLRWEVPTMAERLATLDTALDSLHTWAAADKEHFTIDIGDVTYTDRVKASAALVEELRKSAALLKDRGMGMRDSMTIGSIDGHHIEVTRPQTVDQVWVKFGDLPVPERRFDLDRLFNSDKVTGGDRSAAARSAYNAGYMKQLIGLVTDADRALDDGQWKLEQAQARLDQLEATPTVEFPRTHELNDMIEELTTLQRELRDAANSPEALAADEARKERMLLNGRTAGWSLELNPTPELLKQSGYDTVDDMRAMIAQRRDAARTAAALLAAPTPEAGTPAPAAPEGRSISELLSDTRRPSNAATSESMPADAYDDRRHNVPPLRSIPTPGLET